MTTKTCTCENEAEILYKMYKHLGTLQDIQFTGKSSCCTDEEVTVTIIEHTVTVAYADGTISRYRDEAFN